MAKPLRPVKIKIPLTLPCFSPQSSLCLEIQRTDILDSLSGAGLLYILRCCRFRRW